MLTQPRQCWHPEPSSSRTVRTLQQGSEMPGPTHADATSRASSPLLYGVFSAGAGKSLLPERFSPDRVASYLRDAQHASRLQSQSAARHLLTSHSLRETSGGDGSMKVTRLSPIGRHSCFLLPGI